MARIGSMTGAWVLAFAWVLAANPAGAATVIVNNVNGTGEGFNDSTAVSPVTGNPGTTVGQQRLNAFEAAAQQWAATLVSPITIVIDAQMTSLECDQDSAVLGSAGPSGFIASDFDGAPQANTWYPQALANALSGEDIDPARSDISANFNQDIGQPRCLEALGWSYVIGAPAPAGTIAFTTTVLHEIAHGLGFLTFVDKQSGAFCCQGTEQPDHYSRFLLDETPSPTLWTAMNDTGRMNSAKDDGNLTWAGARVGEVAGLLSTGRHASGRVRLYAPTTLAPGSSVSHWDTAVDPNELMEPFLQEIFSTRLTNHLMLDVGWNAMVELAVGKTDGRASITAGSATQYTITLSHNGPADVSVIGASVSDTFAAALTGVTWVCNASGGAACDDAAGNGDLNTTVDLPLGGTVTYTVDATVDAGFTGTLSNTVTVGMPAGIQNTASSDATDETTVLPPGSTAGITVSPVSGDTSEDGAKAEFTVVLDSQPSHDVGIALSTSDSTEGQVSPTSLLFTDADWNTPRTVTLTGVDDAVDDGDVGWTAIIAAAISDDTDYDGLDAPDVVLLNQDDDTAGISVGPISGNTTEAGGQASFAVMLDSQPLADVTIALATGDASEGSVQPGQLVFDDQNWLVPQDVTVTGEDDAVDDGDVGYAILTGPVSSADGGYHGLPVADVAVTNEDDDTAGITVSAISGPTTEAGGTATFTVVLASEPTASVSIALSSDDPGEGTVAPASLQFGTGDWDQPQQATVTGEDDAVDDGDVAYLIVTAPATSGDPVYDGLDGSDVPVVNEDDEPTLPLFLDGFESVD
ncbi:hypothetical protein [Elongatibacter sediminis]|uniref:DUF11 domain-containing protein n=1 Tax=Elongatibacter sediminis TaxID=3119006 RepID=A0AAW9RIW1_9GAMM